MLHTEVDELLQNVVHVVNSVLQRRSVQVAVELQSSVLGIRQDVYRRLGGKGGWRFLQVFIPEDEDGPQHIRAGMCQRCPDKVKQGAGAIGEPASLGCLIPENHVLLGHPVGVCQVTRTSASETNWSVFGTDLEGSTPRDDLRCR